VIAAAALLLLAPALVADAPGGAGLPPVSFDLDGPVTTTEGHATLEWSADDGAAARHWRFQLQEGETRAFEDTFIRYEGPDRASFVSGLHDGKTWYRVRVVGKDGGHGPWSDPIAVAVDYPGDAIVVRLMGLGLLVLLATAGTIVTGHFRTRERTS